MFGVKKGNLIKVLELKRNECCVYICGDNYCDCKFGYEGEKFGEKNACPEIRQIIEILKNMNEEEFNKICKKAGIDVISV